MLLALKLTDTSEALVLRSQTVRYVEFSVYTQRRRHNDRDSKRPSGWATIPITPWCNYDHREIPTRVGVTHPFIGCL